MDCLHRSAILALALLTPACGSDDSSGAGSGGSGGSAGAPTTCGKPRPGPNSTGVPAGVQLTPSGSMKAETNGQVVEGLDITGSVTVLADNVTIKNCRITSGDYYPIRYFDNGNVGLIVEDSNAAVQTGDE